ncbi:palmitoyltransferase ZDHHC4 isoform X5 [Lepus europaeus]|uniref:palmitoyltransferase ZDHHC4 isoform X5 n=1 Tax=Lepus europaeus TaxID=9983 RepID=UPI002B471C56|nr:palmitoyltransferase ZDHHC4 isoform X5 [Lepus europaeus]
MSAAAWVPPAVPGARRCPRGAAVPLHRAGRKSPSRGRDPESPRQAAVSDCLLVRPPRMEFLVLFLFYLAVVLTSVVLLCVCSKTPRLQGLGRRGAQVFSCVIPERLQRAVQRLLRYLFRTRNYSFLVVHLAVQAMVYTEYTSEIFGYCQELEFPLYYLLQPYLLLAVNLVFFTLTCVTNPGTVTRGNESALLQVYEFDDVMFPKNARCATCDLRKPARSKHCLPGKVAEDGLSAWTSVPTWETRMKLLVLAWPSPGFCGMKQLMVGSLSLPVYLPPCLSLSLPSFSVIFLSNKLNLFLKSF